MKRVQDGMSKNLVRCTAPDVARTLRDQDIGAVPIGGPVAKATGNIVHSKSGHVLGDHVFRRGAVEDTHTFRMAIRFGISADDASTMVYPLSHIEAKQELRKAG